MFDFLKRKKEDDGEWGYLSNYKPSPTSNVSKLQEKDVTKVVEVYSIPSVFEYHESVHKKPPPKSNKHNDVWESETSLIKKRKIAKETPKAKLSFLKRLLKRV
jgi:hypothetical protein